MLRIQNERSGRRWFNATVFALGLLMVLGLNGERGTAANQVGVPSTELAATNMAAILNNGTTSRVSVDSAGNQSNDGSWAPAISADGQCVAFESEATNLVSGDINDKGHIFLHDRETGETILVSVDSVGNQGNEGSWTPSISADCRYIAFMSWASNLVSNDTNGEPDIFVHDRQMGQTTRVSVDSTGNQGNDSSRNPDISADGRYVAFYSWASNLISGDFNGSYDVFVHDRQKGQTTLISLDSAGNQGDGNSYDPAISADGRFVAFVSSASNLISNDTTFGADVYVHDRQTGDTTCVSLDSAGNQFNGGAGTISISPDARYVAFAAWANYKSSGDTNTESHIFIRDRRTDQTTLVSVDSVRNPGNGLSQVPAISADGRYVAFESWASNLVSGDSNDDRDIFVHDLRTEQTTRVSVDSEGNQGDGQSLNAVISANGQYVAFESAAGNLVRNDTNSAMDIFIHDRGYHYPSYLPYVTR